MRLPASAGGGLTTLVTNGNEAWRIADGKGELLTDRGAVSFLEHAFFASLRYLEPDACDARIAGTERLRIEDSSGVRQVDVDVVLLTPPSGTTWRCGFGQQDGRLYYREDEYSGAAQWVQEVRWQKFDGLTVPVARMQGTKAPPSRGIWRIDEVRAGRSLDGGLFAGNPEPQVEAGATSPLVALPDTLPGSAHFALPSVVVNEAFAAPALLDTGAEFAAVDPPSVQRIGLVRLGPSRTIGQFGAIESSHAWFESLRLGLSSPGGGGPRFAQVLGLATPFPAFPALPGRERPAMIVGVRPLLRASPVLDLAAGKLVLRGDPPARLSDASMLAVPLRCDTAGSWTMSLDVQVDGKDLAVMVDTGSSAVLVLTARGLERLGLPTTRAAWLARGAVPLVMHAAGAREHDALAAQVASVQIGSCTFERPWVMVTLGVKDALPFEGLLGGGALLPFARAGIDHRRKLLELEPGPTMRIGDGGRSVVPAPGRLLGLVITSPERGAVAGVDALPKISTAIEGTPAERKGVRAGDYLLAIGERSCAGLVAAEVYPALWVAEEASVTLKLRRGKEDLVVVLP